MTQNELLFEQAFQTALFFPFERRPLYRFYGQDVTRYLHGRVTQDIKALCSGQFVRSLVLTPQGKIQGHFYLAKSESDYLICSDALSGSDAEAEFIKAMLQFKVSDDVQLENESELIAVLQIIGKGVCELWDVLKLPQLQSGQYLDASWEGHRLRVAQLNNGALPFVFLFVDKTKQQAIVDLLRDSGVATLGTREVQKMLRIACGLPEMVSDLNEKIAGPEIDIEACASFSKGCYVGQEVVEMSTARGRPNRTLSLCLADAVCQIESETDIFLENEKAETSKVGFVSSSCVFPSYQKTLALAFVKTTALDAPIFRIAGQNFRRVKGSSVEVFSLITRGRSAQ